MAEGVWPVLSMLLTVALVLALAYLASRWIGSRAAGPGAGKLAAGSGRFRVLGQLSVGRNERLLLVRAGDKCFLIGVTAQSITLLSVLEGDETLEWLSEPEKGPAQDFMELLSEKLRRGK